MSQFGRPSADTNNSGGYTNQAGSGGNLFQSIDEVSPSDTDFIQSRPTMSGAVYVTQLSGVTDPGVDTGHVFRVRAEKSGLGGGDINLFAELRQGYVDESSKGTLIAILGATMTDSFVTFQKTLSEAEAALITDYSDLFLRLSVIDSVVPGLEVLGCEDGDLIYCDSSTAIVCA